jgi:RWP-RK domain
VAFLASKLRTGVNLNRQAALPIPKDETGTKQKTQKKKKPLLQKARPLPPCSLSLSARFHVPPPAQKLIVTPPFTMATADLSATTTITFEQLTKYFHLPINDVAKELGICATMLKKICRKNGIPRWPHRKVCVDSYEVFFPTV